MSTVVSDRNGSLPSSAATAKLRKGGGGVTMITLSSNSLPPPTSSSTTTVVPKATSTQTNRLTASSTSPPPSSASAKNHKPTMTGSACMVCHDMAPKDTVFRRHYGVVCCEACKCFFRRTVQMNRDYKCRYGSSCSIGRSAENLKQVCQACRFNQCIQAGMKMDSVKKFPRKQQRRRGSSTSGDDSGRKSTSKDSGRHGKRTKSTSGSTKDGSGNTDHKSKSVAAMTSSSSSSKEAPPTTNGETAQGGMASNDGVLSPPLIKQESSLRLSETDLVHLKFNVSPPEAMMYLDSNTSVPQLFSYGGSTENLSSRGSPSKIGGGGGGSNSDLTRSSSNPNLSRSGSGSIAAAAGMGMEVGKSSVSHSGVSTANAMSMTNDNTSVGAGNRSSTVEALTGMIKQAQSTQRKNKQFLQLPSSSPLVIGGAGGGGGEMEPHPHHPQYHHGVVHPEQLSQNLLSLGRKRQRLDSSSSAVVMGSHYPSGGGSGGGMVSLSAPHTPITPGPPPHMFPHTHPHMHSHSQPPSRGPSPEIQLIGGAGGGGGNPSSSVYNSHNPTPYGTPHATPHATPIHTPMQSPLPSPNSLTSGGYHYPPQQQQPAPPLQQPPPPPPPQQQHQHHNHTHNQAGLQNFQNAPPNLQQQQQQQKRVFFAASPPSTVNPLSLPGFSAPNILLQPQANTLFLNAQSAAQMPFRVVPMTTPGQSVITPLVPFATAAQSSFSSAGDLSLNVTNAQQFGLHPAGGSAVASSGKSPFTIVPIPSINKTQPDELPMKADDIMKAITRRDDPGSAPPSGRSSPVISKSKSVSATFPEAKLEEVLDSLRLRIRHMFRWAKTEVAGFEDLSPLDQKALLRRTVSELVMLGFANGSIAYNDMLLLGSTGKVIRPTNQNSGVASVASVTLQKLVVPLKSVMINDRELTFLREIVLFNPESNGLRNREVVRQYRKRKHIELMEYTEKNSDDPGRFGELICLLTPLFEVSTEVTEQLRLEQFVHEGEARIDALLLMSMISGNEDMPAETY